MRRGGAPARRRRGRHNGHRTPRVAPREASVNGNGAPGRTNRIIEALPTAAAQRLMSAASSVFLDVNTVLFEAGASIDSIYFPLNGVVSLVTPLHHGATVEVATVGNEGIVGVPMVLGGSLAVRAISGVAGWFVRMDASDFLSEIDGGGPLSEVTDDYVQALFGQISQAVACNRLHSGEERLSRWLLMSHDRVGCDDFAVTHQFLGQMLGSARSTVSRSAAFLQSAGFIRYHQGRVTIVDRTGLESVACECYRVIQAELDSVMRNAQRSTNAKQNGQRPSARTLKLGGIFTPVDPPPTD